MENGFRFIATSTCITNFSPGVAERDGWAGMGWRVRGYREIGRQTYIPEERERERESFAVAVHESHFRTKQISSKHRKSSVSYVMTHATLFEGYLRGKKGILMNQEHKDQ